MKKLKIVLLMMFLFLSLSACTTKQDVTTTPDILKEYQWVYYNPEHDDNEILYFKEDNVFLYQCKGESDAEVLNMYDTWDYVAYSNNIILRNKSNKVNEKKIKLLYIDKNRITLNVNGNIKTYERYDNRYKKPVISKTYTSHLIGYSAYMTISEIIDENIIVGPSYTDKFETDENEKQSLPLAKHCIFESISIKKDKNGKETMGYTELTQQDIELLASNKGVNGFIWLNEDMEVEKIMFYGEMEVD